MSLSGQYIEIDHIIERIYRDYGFDLEVNTSDVFEWAWDVMSLLGIPSTFIDKVTDGNGSNDEPVDVANFRGTLPTDLFSIVLIRDYDTKMPMYCSSSPFNNDSAVSSSKEFESQNTYKIEGGYIYTSFEEGTVEVVYKAFPTSPLGLPMFPDDTEFILALSLYVAEKIAFKMWVQQRLPQTVLEKLEQRKAFAMGAAITKAHIPSIDQMEAIKNRWLRLKQNPNLHDTSFRYIADKERLILHNNAGN